MTGLVGTIETRVGDEVAAQRADHAGGAGPAGAARRDARARGAGGGHGGVQPRAGAGPGRRHDVRRRRVHQPQRGPPRLPRRPGGLLPGQGRRCSRPRGPGSASSTSTTRTAGGWPGSPPCRWSPCRRRATSRTPTGGSTPSSARADRQHLPRSRGRRAWRSTARPRWPATSTWPTPRSRSSPWCAPGSPRTSPPPGSPPARACPGRMERVETGAGGPLALVDYAHTPDAAGPAAGRGPRPGRRRRAGGGRPRRGGDRDPHKRPVMGAIAVRGADVAVLTSDNPRSEDPLAILAAMRGGRRARRWPPGAAPARASSRTGARPSRWPSALAGAGRRASWSPARATRPGQEVAGVVHPFDDRRRARRARCAAVAR